MMIRSINRLRPSKFQIVPNRSIHRTISGSHIAMDEEVKATIASIDLTALQNNYLYAKSLAPSSKTMAVIKANAYGHGDVQAAKALVEIGADGIAVANMAEGVRLRLAGIENPTLLILQGAKTDRDWDVAKTHNLTVMVQNEAQLDYSLSDRVRQDQLIWVKCDTGMHRVGLSPAVCISRLQSVIDKFGVDNFVFCSHFACSDEVGLQFNMEQLSILKSIQVRFGVQWSLANSGGIMSIPDSHGTWNRAGYMLYGNSPLMAPHPSDQGLTDVMTFSAPIIAIRTVEAGESVGYSRKWYAERTSRIATVAVGYADGYPRHAPSGTPVLLNGQRIPLAGRVSMDMITVDITDFVGNVCVGDTVYLWGRDPSGEVLKVNEIAEKAGTIGYELLTKVTTRPRKVYVRSDAV